MQKAACMASAVGLAAAIIAGALCGCTGTQRGTPLGTPETGAATALSIEPSGEQATAAASQEAPAGEREPADVVSIAVDGGLLVQERCTRCHNLARIERATKNADEWRLTVQRMIDKGATLDVTEREAVIAFLTATYTR